MHDEKLVTGSGLKILIPCLSLKLKFNFFCPDASFVMLKSAHLHGREFKGKGWELFGSNGCWEEAISQCEQIARLFVQNLVIYEDLILPQSRQTLPK